MSKFNYRIVNRRIMARGWSSLTGLDVEAKGADGETKILPREVADHGDGAAVLPVDCARGLVLLVRQWRTGAAFNGAHDGWLIEACAGLLDGDNPSDCARREAHEELGVNIRNIRLVADCFSSPGAVSERLMLFAADYAAEDRVHGGGGLDHEHEDIEVIEMPLVDAFALIAAGGIMDAKTIILLQHAMMEQKV
jgi:nudix-type nucleoside diphosphatase (YffH/AdpP family)